MVTLIFSNSFQKLWCGSAEFTNVTSRDFVPFSEAKIPVFCFQNLFKINFLNKKWVYNPLETQKTHFDSKKMPFLRLNNFLTNCCIDLHFCCFWSKKMPKTTDSGHQSFILVSCCRLLAENFKKSAEKRLMRGIYDRGVRFFWSTLYTFCLLWP